MKMNFIINKIGVVVATGLLASVTAKAAIITGTVTWGPTSGQFSTSSLQLNSVNYVSPYYPPTGDFATIPGEAAYCFGGNISGITTIQEPHFSPSLLTFGQGNLVFTLQTIQAVPNGFTGTGYVSDYLGRYQNTFATLTIIPGGPVSVDPFSPTTIDYTMMLSTAIPEPNAFGYATGGMLAVLAIGGLCGRIRNAGASSNSLTAFPSN
jgi:hypothetical protein